MNLYSRRLFLTRATKLGMAVSVVGLTGCSTEGDVDATLAPTTSDGSTTSAATESTTSTTNAEAEEQPTDDLDREGVDWERIDLGFVSAYVLVRRGEATVVDTGVAGSADDIEAVVGDLGVGWSNVAHVVLTHLHPDHIGSLSEVMDRASDAMGYAGEADIAGISAPRPLTAVGDGDQVMGLEIIETPGHTAGHISVFDQAGGLLIAGDSLNQDSGGIRGANAQFSSDLVAAAESVRKMAGLRFDTVVFGHGEPVIGGADARVAALASVL